MNIRQTAGQQKIITEPYQPSTTVKVVSGPGSGKTNTLLYKIADLIIAGELKAEEILVLSLTNKAIDRIKLPLASLLSEKLQDDFLVSQALNDINISTIHAVAKRIVVENEGMVDVIEEEGWRGLAKLIPKHTWARYGNMNMYRKMIWLVRQIQEYNSNPTASDEVIDNVIQIMKNSKVLTNEDILVKAVEYLRATEKTAVYTGHIKRGIKVVFIDEFQDLYPDLVPLLKEICTSKQLIMFGDINQSVYDFLGSNHEAIEQLDSLNPPGNRKIHFLYDNFRNTPEIMHLATQVMPRNDEIKNLNTPGEYVTKSFCGIEPKVNKFSNFHDEMLYTVDEITKAVCASATFSDIAILARSNKHVKEIIRHLHTYGIPTTKLTGRIEWTEDPRLEFVIDIMKLAHFVLHEKIVSGHSPWRCDFSTILVLGHMKGIESSYIQRLYIESRNAGLPMWNYIIGLPSTKRKRLDSLIGVVNNLAEDKRLWAFDCPRELLYNISNHAMALNPDLYSISDLQDKINFRQNTQEMYRVMKQSSNLCPVGVPLVQYFLESYREHNGQYSTHITSGEGYKHQPDTLKVATIHASKGLEFPIVFLSDSLPCIPGLEQRPIDDNILYVGITRARNLLYVNNITHRHLKPRFAGWSDDWKPDTSLLGADDFWRYYNRDLHRPTYKGSLKTNVGLYNQLVTTLGYNVGKRRQFHSLRNILMKIL